MTPIKKNQEDVTLRDHLERIIDDQKELFVTKLQATELATRLTKEANDARLNIMNEFRNAIEDQANRMVTREEHNATLTRLTESVKGLEITRATMDGKASQSAATTAIVLSVLSLLIAIVLHFVK